MKIVLGSASKRRQELLSLIGIDFIVDVLDVDERVEDYSDPSDYAIQAASKKGLATSQVHPIDLVICADTIVVLDNDILGKPKDLPEARWMISSLAGRCHYVLTAVFLNFQKYQKVFIESTKVEFDKMTDREIEDYIHTDEPYDKAGGYAIQGLFGKHVKSIQGDFYNVMGLPLNRLYQEIKEIENKFEIKFNK